ncbi:MAG: molybdate ABC transporter substrate-binding protein [SAR202 cluster bacterium]|nr:molybdate ABC transporter substrate-binding protein [SAR202 cluster bacterium]
MRASRAIKICLGLTMVWALLLAASCGGGSERELLVFTAASLKPALTDLINRYEGDTGENVLISTGGSQLLARQIAAGAPVDVYVPAGMSPVEFLANEGVPMDESVSLVTNRLVIVTKEGEPAPESVAALASDAFSRIAIADPALAPAGAYAREALKTQGVWDAVQGKLVVGSNVRVTIAYVETGNADAALVYATDAFLAADLVLTDVVPQSSHTAIVYPAVVLADSDQVALAMSFVEYLQSTEAGDVFADYGFIPIVAP